MALSLTVLGCSGTHTGRDRMCSSYLVEADGYRLVMDLGNGALGNLQHRIGVLDVDAVLLSHLHPDHFADLYGLYYARRFAEDGPYPVDVHAPAGAREHLAQLLGGDETFGQVCRFSTQVAGDVLALGPLRVELFAADHPVETFAPRVEHGGRVLAYSGDSGPAPALVDCARDADLFVADASWLERDGPHAEGVHMTGAQAGRHAAAAGAGRLLVTHVYPANEPDEVAAEAAGVYDGDVLAAADLLSLEV